MAQRTLIVEKPEPPYPGAPALLTALERDGERGDVRVQDYSGSNRRGFEFKVASFLPGIVEESPGDTPKVWPEIHQHTGDFNEATAIFLRYVEAAKRVGWKEVEPCGT